jgi:hypothetical protein
VGGEPYQEGRGRGSKEMLRELMNVGVFGFIIGNVLLESIFSCRLFGRVITLSWKNKIKNTCYECIHAFNG